MSQSFVQASPLHMLVVLLCLGLLTSAGFSQEANPQASEKLLEVPTPQNMTLKDHIKEPTPRSYVIPYSVFMEEIALITRQTRIVPHYVSGKPAGFRLVHIQADTLLSYLGLKKGDVFKMVNGQELADINQSLEFYEKSIKDRLFRISIERDGKRLNFEYKLQ